MATMEEQYNTLLSAWTSGDFDLMVKVLQQPDAVTLEEQRTVADKLGFKGGLLHAAVDVAADPMTWVAMFLSRKFPVKQWMDGTIPHRFTGAAQEFSGISSFARPISGFHLGTNIPKLTSIHMRRTAEVMKVGTGIFDSFRNRPNWKQEMPIVSMLLEGQKPAGTTSELEEVARKIRSGMNELWGFLSKSKGMEGGFAPGGELTLARATEYPGGLAPSYLRDYLPHIPLWGTDSVMELNAEKALQKFGQGRMAQLVETVGMDASQVWTPTQARNLTSNYLAYQTFLNGGGSKILNERMFKRVRQDIPLSSSMGQDLFVTDLNVVLQKYIHSVARTYANYAPLSNLERAVAASKVEMADGTIRTIMPSEDPIMVQVINEGISTLGGRVLERSTPDGHTSFVVAKGTVNPPKLRALNVLVNQLRGVEDESAIYSHGLFNGLYDIIHSKRDLLGPKKERDLTAALMESEKKRDFNRKAMDGITSYFYASTLGMNFSSSLKNFFQPAVTTANTIGIGPTLRGMRELGTKLPTYMSEFWSQWHAPGTRNLAEAAGAAFEKVFPDLAAQGIRVDPKAFDRISLKDLDAGSTRVRNELTDVLMAPFTAVEGGNRVTTFYGAKHALQNGLRMGSVDHPRHVDGVTPLVGAELETWLNATAGDVVASTQFRPGPGSMTPFQSTLPPIFRQFGSYPVRFANFLAESTVRGALTDKQLQTAGILTKMTGGRNWGPIARTYLYGKVLTQGLREGLGVDMGGALGVMAPYDVNPAGGDVFPLPMPPALSLVAGAAAYATTRDVKHLQPLQLPGIGDVPFPRALFPGGVALSRVGRAWNQFRPDVGGFVDSQERLMYKAGTGDLAMAMLGIPLEKDRRTREALDQIVGTKLRIRELKRHYAHAMATGDVSGADRAAAQYQSEFPDFAGIAPLAASMKDVMRYEQSRYQTAAVRMLQGLGKEIGTQWAFDLQEFEPAAVGEFP